jgi:hypothetical protein
LKAKKNGGSKLNQERERRNKPVIRQPRFEGSDAVPELKGHIYDCGGPKCADQFHRTT